MEDTSTLRTFINRETINLVKCDTGRNVKKNGEIVLEKRYCQEHDLKLGDTIELAGEEFELVGMGCTPDFDSPLKEIADSSVDSVQFGTAFLTEEDYKKDTKFEYMYTYKYTEGQVPDGAYEAFAKTLKKERFGYNLEVTILGLWFPTWHVV